LAWEGWVRVRVRVRARVRVSPKGAFPSYISGQEPVGAGGAAWLTLRQDPWERRWRRRARH